MKKFKMVLWGIIILFLVLVYFQNRPFFETKNSLMLDLYVTDAYHSPQLFIAVWFLAALVFGFLVAYLFSLSEKFKTRKLLKAVKAKVQSQETEIEQLQKELASRTGTLHENAVEAEVVNSSPLTESLEAPSAER